MRFKKKRSSNLELESGVTTINTDWVTGTANYYKIGKQCVVNALVTLKQDTSVNNTLLISGLPAAAQEKVCLIHGTTGYGVFKVLANTGYFTRRMHVILYVFASYFRDLLLITL